MHPNYVNDENEWAKILPANKYFKCAQIGDDYYATYVVNYYFRSLFFFKFIFIHFDMFIKLRTYEPTTTGNSIKLEVKVGSLSMPSILLTPAINSYKKTGGLCGMWNNNPWQDLYILNELGKPEYTNDIDLVKDFWRFKQIFLTFFAKT